MKKHLLSLIFITFSLCGYAQISTYPYVEDFENPSIYQEAPASCDITVGGAVITGWTQDPNDGGDWRADTAGTPSIGTGPGSGRLINGVGIGTDANPGTVGGTYMYTEGTNPTSCGSSEINILSPFFDFSQAGKYYQMKFNYHMLGTGMGSLHIDARVGSQGTWTTSLWSQVGEKDSAWILDSVNLAGYNNDSVQLRIRGVMGTNFLTDMAFDNVQIDTFSPVLAEAILISTNFLNFEYPIIPMNQFDSLEIEASARNEGLQNITETEVEFSEGTFSATIDLDTIAPFTNKSGVSSTKYFPSNIGVKNIVADLTIAENDNNITNNSDTITVEISDSVMARENLATTANGIGSNNGVLELGQRFEINNDDTVTSISFYISNPPAGDSLRVHFYSYSGSAPSTLLSSSQAIALIANQNWYTLPLGCFTPVSSGQYFASVEQITNSSNMSLGYTEDFFTPNTCYFGSPVVGWTALETVNFSITALIRLNFGEVDTYREVNISAGSDTICEGGQVIMSADAGSTFLWEPANKTFDNTSQQPFFTLDETTEITVLADFGCGLSARDSLTVFTESGPTGTVIPDSTICLGESISLTASGGSGYSWSTGPSNMPWTVSPTTRTSYLLIVDSTNGCNTTYTTTVDVSQASVLAEGDTAACTGEMITVMASGADTYQWDNGAASSTYTFAVNSTEYKYVTGTNTFGCTARDSVLITENIAPLLVPMNDTGACFTNFITIRTATQATNFLWDNGNTGDSVRFQMFAPKTHTLIADNGNGCVVYDTVVVSRYLPPTGSISPSRDTTICEGTSIDVTAGGGATYEWSDGQSTATATFAPNTKTSYDVIIRSAEGCEDYENITIDLAPLPTASFRYREFKDSVTFTNESSLATSYSWDFGDGQSSTDENTYNIYKDSGDYTVTLTATNECGSRDSSITINVEVPVIVNGINDRAKWGAVELYPNPATESIYYSLKNTLMGDVTIELFDLQGKLLYSEQVIKSKELLRGSISLAELAVGIYTLRMTTNNSTLASKIIKK